VSYDVPLLDNIEQINFYKNECYFKLPNNDNWNSSDKLIKAITGLLESRKKSTIYAVSEVIGKILNK
jgi:hypothetical protein